MIQEDLETKNKHKTSYKHVPYCELLQKTGINIIQLKIFTNVYNTKHWHRFTAYFFTQIPSTAAFRDIKLIDFCQQRKKSINSVFKSSLCHQLKVFVNCPYYIIVVFVSAFCLLLPNSVLYRSTERSPFLSIDCFQREVLLVSSCFVA